MWRDVVDVNLTGASNTCRAALPHVNDGGSVVLTNSVLGLRGAANMAPCVASKHAVVGLMRALIAEPEVSGRRSKFRTAMGEQMATQDSVETATDGIVARISAEIGAEGPMSFVQRTATIEGVPGTVEFGVHGPFREHYGTKPGQFPEQPTTNEVFSAAVVSCLTGTFAAMLEMRGVALTRVELRVQAQVDIGPPADAPSPWIVRGIAVHYEVTVPDGDRAKVERVHGLHEKQCWLSQTLKGSRCEVSTTLSFA